MTTILEYVRQALTYMTWLELIAVIFSIIYLLLIAKGNILGWWAAVVSVCIYIYLCLNAALLAETGLQVFYLIMAFYGMYKWKENSETAEETIKWGKLKMNVITIIASLLFAVALGFILQQYTAAALPYLNAFTTSFSLAATWMVAKKLIENWLYWIVIDGAAVFMYAERNLYLTAFLMFVFTILAVYGFIQWRRAMQLQHTDA